MSATKLLVGYFLHPTVLLEPWKCNQLSFVIEIPANAVSLSKISIKTGRRRKNADSGCKAVLKICDKINCCETTLQGGGKGEIDEYSGSSILNSYAHVGRKK